MMNFGQALECMKNEKVVYRPGWKKDKEVVFLAREASMNIMGVFGVGLTQFMARKTEDGLVQPGWMPNMEDMLAEDWEEFDEDSVPASLEQFLNQW